MEKKPVTSEAQRRANLKYARLKTHAITIRFVNEIDMDAYEWLNQQENKTRYIIELIRKDKKEREQK